MAPGIEGQSRRGRALGPGSGDAVAPLENALDTSRADELVQGLGDGGGPGCGVFPDLALGERRCGFGERLEDALLGRPGLRRGLGRPMTFC